MDKSKISKLLSIKVFDFLQISEDDYNAKCTRVYILKNESEDKVPITNDFTEWFSTDSCNHRIIEEELQRDQILPTYKESFRIRADWQPSKRILSPKGEHQVKIIWDWLNFVKDRGSCFHLDVPYDSAGELRHYNLQINPPPNKFFSFKNKNITITPPPSKEHAIDNNNLIIQRKVSGNKKFNFILEFLYKDISKITSSKLEEEVLSKVEGMRMGRKQRINAASLPRELNKISNWVTSLAKGQCPEELLKFNKKPDELLEFYLHLLFLDLLSLDCQAWGQIESRFKAFSDGYFLLPRKPDLTCLYDAKAYSKGYNASKEILKLANYVVEHKADIKYHLKSEITYFMVISSEFRGDTKKQAREFHRKSGVKLVLCRAEDLVYFTREVREISENSSFLKTVKWEEILSGAEPFLNKEMFDKELKRLKQTFRNFFL